MQVFQQLLQLRQSRTESNQPVQHLMFHKLELELRQQTKLQNLKRSTHNESLP